MRAVKGNKSYIVDEKTKARYLGDGFDIVDDNGKVLESGKGKTVSYEQYQKLTAENATLKEQLASASDTEAVKALQAENKDLKKQLASAQKAEK